MPNLYTTHCMLHIVNRKLPIVHSTLDTAQCKLHNIHCTVYTDHSTLYSAVYTQSYNTCSLNMRSIGQDESTQTLFLLTSTNPRGQYGQADNIWRHYSCKAKNFSFPEHLRYELNCPDTL